MALGPSAPGRPDRTAIPCTQVDIGPERMVDPMSASGCAPGLSLAAARPSPHQRWPQWDQSDPPACSNNPTGNPEAPAWKPHGFNSQLLASINGDDGKVDDFQPS
jgi:hypothetical protein